MQCEANEISLTSLFRLWGMALTDSAKQGGVIRALHMDAVRHCFEEVTLTLIIVILLLVAPTACRRSQKQTTPPPVPVKAMQVIVRDQPVYSEYIGLTRGSQEVEIRARVEGVLEAAKFKEGSFVKKSDLLYIIDPKPYEAALNDAKGQLSRAEVAWVNARQDVERFEPLIQRNAISRQQYDQAVAAERANAAAVQSAKASVVAAQLQLGYTQIRSPVDGRIGKTEVQPGNLVGKNQSTLLTIISVIDPINARFSVSEQEHLDWVRNHPDEEHARAALSNKFELVLADGTHYEHKGSIVFVDRNIDPSTGTLLIEVAYPNPRKVLRPGLYARVLLPKTVVTNAVLVPQRAVRELQATYSVVVAKPDGTAEVRPVTPGARVGSLWIIQSGLKPGEIVVVEGLQKVQPNVKLNVTMVTTNELENAPAAPPPKP